MCGYGGQASASRAAVVPWELFTLFFESGSLNESPEVCQLGWLTSEPRPFSVLASWVHASMPDVGVWIQVLMLLGKCLGAGSTAAF